MRLIFIRFWFCYHDKSTHSNYVAFSVWKHFFLNISFTENSWTNFLQNIPPEKMPIHAPIANANHSTAVCKPSNLLHSTIFSYFCKLFINTQADYHLSKLQALFSTKVLVNVTVLPLSRISHFSKKSINLFALLFECNLWTDYEPINVFYFQILNCSSAILRQLYICVIDAFWACKHGFINTVFVGRICKQGFQDLSPWTMLVSYLTFHLHRMFWNI